MKTDAQHLAWQCQRQDAAAGVRCRSGVTGVGWVERDLATRSARGSSGVRSVVDKMNLVD